MSQPGHKALHNLVLTSSYFSVSSWLLTVLSAKPSVFQPQGASLALLAPWDVLPRGYDSFFLPFGSHLFREVPLRCELHTGYLSPITP